MTDTPKRFYLVEDDAFSLALMEKLVTDAGHEAWSSQSSRQALEEIPQKQPDCVLTDIMMPELDGYELCQRLRATPGLDDLKIVMVSSKGYDFDRRRARQVGADGYIVKPISLDTFVEQVEKIIGSQIHVRYWGVRGTLPVPGSRSLRYGGNTSCVALTLPDDRMLIFDAGSGIKSLGDHMMDAARRHDARIFISHPHWDHINCLPLFAPLYSRGNQFEIMGPAHGDMGIRELLEAQMDGVYFPVTSREFGAAVTFRDLREETLEVAGVTVSTMLLSHPGTCLGYRVTHGERSLCYVTDNELFLPSSPLHDPHYVDRLRDFVAGTDVLITDSTYTDEAYVSKVGWGHSCLSQVVDLAHSASVRALHLFHHDPDDTDEDIDAKLDGAREQLQSRGSQVDVVAPAEGDTLEL